VAEYAPARKVRKKTVFRHPLHSIVRLLIALPLATAAAPALAQADVDEVLFIVTVARSSVVSDEFTAEFRVKGTGLNNGSITVPGSLGTIGLSLESPDLVDLVGGIAFNSEAQLATLLPAGNYALSVNNGTVQATLAYQRPPVPSPAISQPGADEVVPPGAVDVQFTACAVCNFGLDSVQARLEDGAMNALASETLLASDDSWIPPDGIGDFQLPEDSAFLARITHTTVRESSVAANGDPSLLFRHTFIQSDEVAFRSGFSPSVGDFCVAVNDPTLPAGCSPLDDPLLALLDTGDTISTSVGGHDVDYTFTVGSKGDLTGNAMADLDDDGSKETVGAIKGKLKGKGGELKQKLSFPLVNEALQAKLKVSVSDVLSIPLDSLARTQKASGNLGALKVKEETAGNGALPVAPKGWRVNFTIDAAGNVQNGLLTLDGGRSFVLEGTNKFNLATNLSSLKLQTADKGIKLQLKKVELDDAVVPGAVVGGDLSFKILGQKGKTALP
jgi:hypothetical protein